MKQTGLNRILSGIAGFLPHLLMAYSWMMLTFAVINTVNDAMGFLSSRTSRHFEVIYFTVAVLTAVAAFCQKKCRIPAAVVCAAGIALIIPGIQAMVQDSPVPLTTGYFNLIAGVFGVLTLIFSIALIVMQRVAAKKTPQKNHES